MTDAATNGQPLLRVDDLKTYFPVKRGIFRHTVGYVKAVDGVSLFVRKGETLGLVGESGCGKSTVGRTILRLIEATSGGAKIEGRVHFDGQDVFAADRPHLKALRRQMQIIFQDPIGSLNPRMTIGRIIGEPIAIHRLARGSELQSRVNDLLNRVGLSPSYANRYPHEFSGGQRQRIGIARALSLEPRFIVCDEPVSALDVSIQAQILNLLAMLKHELGLSFLFIAHNLAVIEHFCDRVAVMYLGKLVEVAERTELYHNPRHPYTQALLSAAPIPDPNPKHRSRIVLPGEVPSPVNPPTGCTFHPRCHLTRTLAADPAHKNDTVSVTVLGEKVRVIRKCVEEAPTLDPVVGSSDPTHCAACWFSDQAAAATAEKPPKLARQFQGE
jgi:peptide/nickel transport system ATP-binding protein